jgi:hypothetical protein
MSTLAFSLSRIPRTGTISFMRKLLVEFWHESHILARTYQIIRLDALKAVMGAIVRSGYVVPSVGVINRLLWVPKFPLSTIGVNDHS